MCTVNNSENIKDIERDVGAEQLYKSENESSKIFIPLILNGFRVTGHLDSGSDVSIMQYSLYFNLRKSTNFLIDSIHPINVKNLTSFSGDNIPVQGEIFVNLKFGMNMPSTRFRIYIIKDIVLTPPLLLGDDLFKTFLGSVSYVEQCGIPFPLVHFIHFMKSYH